VRWPCRQCPWGIDLEARRTRHAELERVDGARFNYAIGERLYLTAIAVQTERNSTLLLNLHRIVNVNRLAIEKHLAIIGLRQRLCVIETYILNELLAQFWTENVPVSVDDGSGGVGIRHLEYLYRKSQPNTWLSSVSICSSRDGHFDGVCIPVLIRRG
jgi:hypothetical protein